MYLTDILEVPKMMLRKVLIWTEMQKMLDMEPGLGTRSP